MTIISCDNPKVLMIRMTRQEAIRTIESLAAQLSSGDPNGGRYECYCECGTDFSIAVNEQLAKGREQ